MSRRTALSDRDASAPRRLVLLGASNLTRGFATVLDVSRQLWGAPLEILAAHGLGRSYGLRSTVLVRQLPGIRQCGLWEALQQRPSAATAALITDIGNDLLYEVPVAQVVDWVGDCLERLRQDQAQIVMTLLPLANLETLSPLRYRFFRSLTHPACRLSLETMTDRARELDLRLRQLGAEYGTLLVEPRTDWYGLDPIHIVRRKSPEAWREILAPLAEVLHSQGIVDYSRLPVPFPSAWKLAPECRWLFGRERHQAQPVAHWPGGTTLSLF